MKINLNTDLDTLDRVQVRRFVRKFGEQFPKLLKQCEYGVARTYDRTDSWFGSMPFYQMRDERDYYYRFCALRMQGVEQNEAMNLLEYR
jgi:hypothetical protein